jgi:hypothetical protein
MTLTAYTRYAYDAANGLGTRGKLVHSEPTLQHRIRLTIQTGYIPTEPWGHVKVTFIATADCVQSLDHTRGFTQRKPEGYNPYITDHSSRCIVGLVVDDYRR